MAHKDDTQFTAKRSRVKYACDPVVKSLIEWVNMFPPLSEMKEIEVPARPTDSLKLFRSFKFDRAKEAAKLKEKTIEYYKEIFSAGLQMVDDLMRRGFSDAVIALEFQQDCKKFQQAEIEWTLRKAEFLEYERIAFAEPRRNRKKQLEIAIVKLKESGDKLSTIQGSFGEIWIERYSRMRRIKQLLEHLAFVGRSFENTGRQLNEYGILDIRFLLPSLYIDDDGILNRGEDPIIKLFLGVNVTRIRMCKVCQQFFWAQRKDRQCCANVKCKNTYNKRLSRERKETSGPQYREAVKLKRKKNSKMIS